MPEACNSNLIEHAAHITTHQGGTGQDGTWYSRCGCGELACASGTHECVAHQDQDGWHCIRVLHTGQPCHTPPSATPTQDRRGQHATVDVQSTPTAASQPLTPTALAQPDLPTLDTHPTLGGGSPGGREAGSGKAASSTTDPDQPHDLTV